MLGKEHGNTVFNLVMTANATLFVMEKSKGKQTFSRFLLKRTYYYNEQLIDMELIAR